MLILKSLSARIQPHRSLKHQARAVLRYPHAQIFASTLSSEDVYLKGYESVAECRAGLDAFFKHYNTQRWHQALDYRLPMDVYREGAENVIAA